MSYLTLNDVAAALPERFPDDSYVRYLLIPDEIRQMEQKVGEKIPREVRGILARFDLSSLEFGELVFGVPGRTIYLETLNVEDYSPYPWWGKGLVHPKGVLAVALDTDGVIILDCSDGKILYFDGNTGELFPVGHNLEEFILFCANFLWEVENDVERFERNRQAKRPTLGERFWRRHGVEMQSS